MKKVRNCSNIRSFELSFNRQRVHGAFNLAETLSVFETEHGNQLDVSLFGVVLGSANRLSSAAKLGVIPRQEISLLGINLDKRVLRHRCHFLSIMEYGAMAASIRNGSRHTP
jgi:hypothetical protein